MNSTVRVFPSSALPQTFDKRTHFRTSPGIEYVEITEPDRTVTRYDATGIRLSEKRDLRLFPKPDYLLNNPPKIHFNN